MTLEGRVAVIAGATGSLGRVVASRLAEPGARLALLGSHEGRLQELVESLGVPADRALAHVADLRQPAAAQAAAGAVLARFGRVDILLHLVGGWSGGTPVAETPSENVAEMLQQHLWTTWHMAQAFVPRLVANGWGRVVVVSSPDASRPPANRSPYAIGKAAQEALMLTLAQELRGSGVTANVVLVQAIDAEHRREGDATGKYAAWTAPEEIAALILYLCSDEAGMVNGACIPLYGRP